MNAQLSCSDRLHILHLEDNAADGELTGSAIKREWPFAQIDRVESRETFLAALGGGDFDLILSDYTIPGFSGLSALDLVRRLKPHIPYVFFSGTIGEDKAVEALKCGATDYVIKDRPGRLIPAVRRALNEVRERRSPDLVTFADGVAHHFNNAFGPILLALPVIRRQAIDHHVRGLLDAVESSARRGADLVRQLQAFVRGEKTEIGEVAPEAAPPIKAGSGPKIGRQRLVLVIDDEDCLRKVVKMMLEASGYGVVLAANGAEGVAAYRSRREEIAAVLTDMAMPVMQGAEVIRELSAINPDVRIVVMSGLGEPSSLAKEGGRRAFLRKPIKRADLIRALEEVLSVPSGS